MMSDYKVEMINDGMQEFYVHFHGPSESNFPFFYIFFLLNSMILMKEKKKFVFFLLRVFDI